MPGYLQAKRGSHIVITTIMFNWLASVLIVYLLVNVLREPHSMNPETRAFPEQAQIPFMHEVFGAFGIEIPPSQLNLTLVLALAAAYCVWLLIYRSRLGYAIRVVGSNPSAAVYAGISPARITIIAMVLSGALAGGLAVNELMGYQHRLLLEFTSGYGFVGIAVALMGRAHPVGIILASLLFGILYQGGAELAFEQPAITRDMVVVIGGIIILFAGALDGLFRRARGASLCAPEAGEGVRPWISAFSSRSSTRPCGSRSRCSPPALPGSGPSAPAWSISGSRARCWWRPSPAPPAPMPSARPGSAFSPASCASVAFALVHGFASISQRGNQIVSGVAINMLAAGLTAIVGNAWYGQGGRTPPLEGDQRFGAVLFGHSALVYVALLAVPVTWFVLGQHPLRPAPARGRREPGRGRHRRHFRGGPALRRGHHRRRAVRAGRRLSLGRPVGRLPAQHDRGQGLHRARRPDLRQVAGLAGARRLLPLRPARRQRQSSSRASRCRESARCRYRRSRRCPIL